MKGNKILTASWAFHGGRLIASTVKKKYLLLSSREQEEEENEARGSFKSDLIDIQNGIVGSVRVTRRCNELRVRVHLKHEWKKGEFREKRGAEDGR